MCIKPVQLKLKVRKLHQCFFLVNRLRVYAQTISDFLWNVCHLIYMWAHAFLVKFSAWFNGSQTLCFKSGLFPSHHCYELKLAKSYFKRNTMKLIIKKKTNPKTQEEKKTEREKTKNILIFLNEWSDFEYLNNFVILRESRKYSKTLKSCSENLVILSNCLYLHFWRLLILYKIQLCY